MAVSAGSCINRLWATKKVRNKRIITISSVPLLCFPVAASHSFYWHKKGLYSSSQ